MATIENIQTIAQTQTGVFCSPELILNENPVEQWWVVTDEGEVLNITREKIDGVSRTLALLADKGGVDCFGQIPESRDIPVFRLFGGLWLRTGYTRNLSVVKVVRINSDGTATVFCNQPTPAGITKTHQTMATQINLIPDPASIEAFACSFEGMDKRKSGEFFDTVVSECIVRLAEVGIDCPDAEHLLALIRTDAVSKNRGVEILRNHLSCTISNRETNQGKIDFWVAKASPRVQWERKDDEDKDIVIRDFTDIPTPKDMKLINLTPHEINVAGSNGEIIAIPASGLVARRDEQHISAEPITVDGVEFTTVIPKFGDVYVVDSQGNRSDFPQPETNTFFIVSMQVQVAMPERTDVITVFKFDKERGCAVGFCRNS